MIIYKVAIPTVAEDVCEETFSWTCLVEGDLVLALADRTRTNGHFVHEEVLCLLGIGRFAWVKKRVYHTDKSGHVQILRKFT